jgi:hypothetical protein
VERLRALRLLRVAREPARRGAAAPSRRRATCALVGAELPADLLDGAGVELLGDAVDQGGHGVRCARVRVAAAAAVDARPSLRGKKHATRARGMDMRSQPEDLSG